jgi:hypothetical protein
MRCLVGGLFACFLACAGSPEELPGVSLVEPKIAQQENPTSEKSDTSVMGEHFHFDRPVNNLLFRRAKKQEGEVQDPPPLTGKHVGAVNDLVELSLQVQLTEAQKVQLRDAVLAEYEAGGERRAGVLNAPLAWSALAQVYEKATPAERIDLIQNNKELFIRSIDTSPEFLYKRVIQSIIAAQQNIAAQGPPALTQQHVNCQLEMFEFMLSIYLRKPFTFSGDDREALTNDLVIAYNGLPNVLRNLFIKSERHPDLLWTLLRYQWAQMDKDQRQSFRESLVAVFGYPVFKDSEKHGAEALQLLSESALSAEMRRLITPKLGLLLEQMAQLSTPNPSVLGYLIYDF